MPKTGFVFRNYHYALTYINWKSTEKKREVYTDINYIIIIIDRIFIPVITKIKKIIAKIPIRGLKSKIYYSDEYIVLIFYIKGVLFDNTRAFVQITRKIHVVDDFKTDIFIETNILISERMIIDFVIQFIKIDNCRDIIVFMDSRARSEFIKRTMKLSTRIMLPSRITVSMSIIYSGELLINRDLFFESQCALFLNQVDKIYVHIINVSFRTIQIKNDIDFSVVISRKTRLNILNEYNQNGYFFIEIYHANFIIIG